jgi:holo-[acyl-carrier protein] synthase
MMMNIGIDIEETIRFRKYLKNPHSLKTIFSKDEIKYCLSKSKPELHLAARFCTKEAVWKAISAKNKKLIIADISIKNTNTGKPEVYVKGKRVKRLDISISHTQKYAAAVALVW